jgi:hypothetical protein
MSPCENITLTLSPANGDITAAIMTDYSGYSNRVEMNIAEIMEGMGEINAVNETVPAVEVTTGPGERVTAQTAPKTAGINDDGSTSDDEEHEGMEFHYEKTGTHQFVPTIAEAEAAFGDIKKILKPPRKKGTGYDHHGLNELTHSCIEAMRRFLWKYTTGNNTVCWITASLETA